MAQIAQIAHDAGALLIAGVDPISLGVLAAPGSYGADIVVGDLQTLGVHLSAGGGVSGFIAFNDDPVFCTECPLALYTILETEREGEYAFGEVDGRAHQLRPARAGQGLGRHGVGPVDHRRRRLHVAHGSQRLPGDRRDDHQARALRGRAAARAARRERAPRRRVLQGVRRRASTTPANASPRSTRPCSSAASSAATTSRRSSRSSARARCTA